MKLPKPLWRAIMPKLQRAGLVLCIFLLDVICLQSITLITREILPLSFLELKIHKEGESHIVA